MQKITLPGADLQPTVICLGTGEFGSIRMDREAAFAMLDFYVEQGGNFLDTASVYANWLPGERHSSEKTLGRWMQARRNRHEIVIGTKGAHPELETMHISRLSPKEIVHDLETSLRNLQTEVIDLYWLHRDDPTRPAGEIIETLQAQVQAGKIHYFGCSNWRTERIRAAQEYAAQTGRPGFVANQMLWNLGRPDFEVMGDPTIAGMDESMWQYHRQTNLAAIPYSSQANGFFTKLAQGREGAIREGTQRVYHHPENYRRAERVQTLSAETGLSATQIVLGYLLAQPFPTIPIVGCRTLDQLADSLSASEVTLSAAQIAYLAGN